MLKNHLKLAWRNLFKRKGYTTLNILGLSIGITCCLLIFNYVAYERSYDRFPKDATRIVRLRLDAYQKGKLAWQSATVYPAIAPTMKKEFPEVEDFCRLIDADILLTNPARNAKFNETKGYYADPSALNMLGVHLTEGNPATALDGPDKMLLSESMAHKYFGNEPALGKRLEVKGGWRAQSYEITGVFKDYPANSHLILHHLISYSTLGKQLRMGGDSSNSTETAWGWYDFYAYVKLKPGADWHALQDKLPAFCDRHINNDEWRKKNNARNELYLIPLTDIHLNSNYNQEAEVNGNGKAVGFLFLIAFLIISIAWVNYTNLATARSLERAREVGVRKVLGAFRRDLVLQFLTESLLLNVLALIVATALAFLFAAPFARLVGSDVAAFHLPTVYLLGFAAIFLAGAILSGIYPAFVLSGYHPITVLKGLFKNTAKGQVLRKGLIIGQFATSVILIVGTILVWQQVQFMRRGQLGFNMEQTLVVEGAASLQDSVYKNVFAPFKISLLQQPGIKSVTASTNVMGQEIYWTNGIARVGETAKSAVTLYLMAVDYDFLPAYNMKLVTGRNFSRQFTTDNKAALINERAMEQLGFRNAAEALGAKLKRGRDTLNIIGVVANYHHQGLQKAIDPMLILPSPDVRGYYSVKLNAGDPHRAIAAVKTAWDHYFPQDPFNYFFLDESFNQQYKADTRFGQVFGLFAFLAIGIACFGLLGLSAYNVLQRTKEIGIRKVLGASAQSLIILLSKEFLYLVGLSLVVAIPVSWWVMHNWLQDFAYRIDIEWWVFALGGVLALGIALATVGFQALRAAMDNPVNSLRNE